MGRVRIYKVLKDDKLEEVLGEGYETTADALKHLRVAGKAGEIYITGLMAPKVRLEARMMCVPVTEKTTKGGD